MFQVEADQSGNLLTIRFAGRVGIDEAKRCEEETAVRVRELQPGFRLLTDLSRLEVMDPECAPYVEQTMEVLDSKGVATVVRVIPDPQKDIGFNIMSLFHYRRRIRMVTCETLEEAMRALAD